MFIRTHTNHLALPVLSDYSYFRFWFVIGASLVIFVVYISLTATPPNLTQFKFGDKVGHLLGYAVLSGWFTQLYRSRNVQISIVIGFCVLGISLEIAQGYGGVRRFEYADMLANTLGAVFGGILSRTWFAGLLLKVDRFLAARF